MSITNDELMHYGILGQKWGKRRYQNKDGSLTSEGKKRYGTKDNFEKQYTEDVKNTMNKAKNGMNKASGTVKKAQDFNDKKVKKSQEEQIKKDVSKMSDQELQKIVNRLNMEERYKQVMNSRASENGKDKVSKILEYAGTALAVGVGAMEIMIKLQELKKK